MQFDEGKIDDAALALLYLTLHAGNRAWKTLDWDAMDRLYQRGLISKPASRAKSVTLSDDGLALSKQLAHDLFAAKMKLALLRDSEQLSPSAIGRARPYL